MISQGQKIIALRARNVANDQLNHLGLSGGKDLVLLMSYQRARNVANDQLNHPGLS